MLKALTETEEGELMKYYVCGYCGHKQRKSFNIARLKVSDQTTATTV